MAKHMLRVVPAKCNKQITVLACDRCPANLHILKPVLRQLLVDRTRALGNVGEWGVCSGGLSNK